MQDLPRRDCITLAQTLFKPKTLRGGVRGQAQRAHTKVPEKAGDGGGRQDWGCAQLTRCHHAVVWYHPEVPNSLKQTPAQQNISGSPLDVLTSRPGGR